MIAILALVALMSAYMIASALSSTGSGLEREQRSMNALREAKAALIAYAANEQWQLYKGQAIDQPGALPCPDILADDGVADCVGPGIGPNTSLIGRLPWASIGASDLRDASGERLWYALSYNFRKDFGNTIINSDTPGQLTVVGTAPASNVVAVLFAPGEPILAQNRPSNPSDPAHNSPANYLEGFNLADPVNFVFTSNPRPSDSFNDRVIVITQAELMAAVEPVVAARIEKDVKPLFQDYFNIWGAFPFAMPFASPPANQSSYVGSQGQKTGLLPITNTSPSFAWLSSPITVVQIPGGTGSSTVTGTACSLLASPLRVRCQVDYSGWTGDRVAIQLDIPISNVHTALANAPSMPDPLDIAMTDRYGNPISPGANGAWSSSSPNFTPKLGFKALATRGTVIYTGRLRSAESTDGRVFITVVLPAPPGYLPRLTNVAPTNPNISWFTSNKWYQQTFYVVSDSYAPGGAGSCPPCLTVNQLPTPTGKPAILILAGRALDGSGRPSGSMTNYLEGDNATITDGIFEHRFGAPAAINDRVVVVAPPP